MELNKFSAFFEAKMDTATSDVWYDPFMMTTVIVVTILLIVLNLYMLAYFSHYADSFFGSSAMTKFILVSAIAF